MSLLPSHVATVSLASAAETPLLGAPVAQAAASGSVASPETVEVFEIDPNLADTAALMEAFDLPAEASANCVVVAGTRGEEERIAACVVLASTKADVNKRIRKLLDARKASFLPMDRAVAESGMEYGGIGPIGLPESWRLLVDSRVVEQEAVVIGSGVRGSKIMLPGAVLAQLPGAEVVEDLAVEVTG
ncbi:YbaK/EbsC family protein [Brevibacterium album]|uniref:YbaK/EbsC family protein n=1 Tax=Brevibacterium album TaxID=417948 RepID=UPI00040F511C|nr:YbaK/EbsC family protein [Brevibacterium album]